MVANPIQKRTRNSFLLGMLVMLLIAVVIIAILYFTIFADAINEAQTKGQSKMVNVYRLTAEVKSGEELQSSKLELAKLYTDDLPKDYIGSSYDIKELLKCKSKLDLQPGTIISASLLYAGEEMASSTRIVEYNMLTLPSNLKVGDYVDVRFVMPSGEDYIVLAKKQIVSLQKSTVGLHLNEDEILMMSSAVIESYIMKASNLYVVQYVEAGIQSSAVATYPVNQEVYQLVQSYAQRGKLLDNYNANLRAIVEQELQQYQGAELVNIETGIQEQKEKAMSLYLSGLEED